MNRKINTFTVLPDTPKKLKNLQELAYNLYFSWNHDVLALFQKLDPETWKEARDNPVRMLCLVSQEKLEQAASDKNFKAELAAIYDRFKNYMEATTWFDREYGVRSSQTVAYFSAEYGLHECLPIYSGGLGALSGDHVKSASDLGVPLVAVGLLYSQGYFRQHLNSEGMQQESYPLNDWYSKPVFLEKDAEGVPLQGEINLAGETVYFHIWRVDVGRVKLYLLDTNIIINKPEFRKITNMLYDPDREIRLQQEILLGMGGIRALNLLGITPSTYHVNEGHSAFLLLERIQRIMKKYSVSFHEAKCLVWTTSVFTTHTPVPAGNEAFGITLIEKYFKAFASDIDMSWTDFLRLGTLPQEEKPKEFSMTILALNLAAYANGVSRLHGVVSRSMWQALYPGIPKKEIPIEAVVNGVHARTWMAPSMHNLFLRYGGPSVITELSDFSLWAVVDQIPSEELWTVHENNRKQLVEYVRHKLRKQIEKRGVHNGSYSNISEILDPKALTIGFARRFATYKRGFLLFQDLERLKKIIQNEKRKIQFVFAGKAHPADQAGKEIIKKLFEISNNSNFRHSVVFVEDYDLDIASYLVQGVDVWLNTPKRPQEACGTSGMKAAVNGGINCSVLDGWWDEAYVPDVGWAIGQREEYQDAKEQDQMESEILYGILEREIIPLFYDRDEDGIPQKWVKMMKNSMRELGAGFNSHRMLRDYTEKYYLIAEDLQNRLSANELQEAKELARWRHMVTSNWNQICVERVESLQQDFINKGETLEVKTWIRLQEIKPENVIVECYYGPMDNHDQFEHTQRLRMKLMSEQEGVHEFRAAIPCDRGGRYGFTVRVLPGHPNLAINLLPGLVKWYEGNQCSQN